MMANFGSFLSHLHSIAGYDSSRCHELSICVKDTRVVSHKGDLCGVVGAPPFPGRLLHVRKVCEGAAHQVWGQVGHLLTTITRFVEE
ncbi:hypothetical protein B296_00029492 [Ensete ventricosum]|uniref:Uncharacterized protein n=1 Tax=Ensete ventricosum TaxID=4639 RepID=A0A426XVJ0_ENSVE|nr:hypothetical protein B296_00029492 [Ensete ventricosum]